MFWSDQGKIRKIERCSMDGSNRKVIVMEGIIVVDSLVLGKLVFKWRGTNKCDYFCVRKLEEQVYLIDDLIKD